MSTVGLVAPIRQFVWVAWSNLRQRGRGI